jgi:penicillin-binding protein 2
MSSPSDASPALRLTFLAVIVIALFVALFARLWFLQVLAGDRYVELADSNRLRTVVIEAPRGSILASDGEQLVRNRPALTISADRQELLDLAGAPKDEAAAAVIDRLAELLDLEPDAVFERLTSRRYSPFRPVPIAFDVTPETVFAVRENQELFPGVVAETLPVREYPFGATAAHALGYLNEITEAELADERFAAYRGGDVIGRDGVERSYEEDLRGVAGQRVLVVNARGNVLDVQSEREPVEGHNLVTTLDLDLQRATEKLLEDGILSSRELTTDDDEPIPSVAGSAIILDARDARVLAMASFPSYDPREFIGGLSSGYAEYLYADPDHPQPSINRVITGRYPPGSVFKVVSGAAMMETGLAGPRTQIECPPEYEVGGNTFRNWNDEDEGRMDLSDAMKRSCDTYFYDLAYRQWVAEQRQLDAVDDDLDQLDEVQARVSREFGYGSSLGIDLPNEAAGVIPDRQTKLATWTDQRDLWCELAETSEPGYRRDVLTHNCQFGYLWLGGDAINTSIGQGEILVSPLQVAASYVAIANGGQLLQPRVGEAVLDQDGEVIRRIETELIRELDTDPAVLDAIRDGLERVVMEQRGTAEAAFRGFPLDDIPVAGKTGTAELKPLVPYAWFAAYAPADDPEVVIVVTVEQGNGGSQTAAPIARNILEHHFGITDAEEAEFEAGPAILD